MHCFCDSSDISCQGPPDFEDVEKRTQAEIDNLSPFPQPPPDF